MILVYFYPIFFITAVVLKWNWHGMKACEPSKQGEMKARAGPVKVTSLVSVSCLEYYFVKRYYSRKSI